MKLTKYIQEKISAIKNKHLKAATILATMIAWGAIVNVVGSILLAIHPVALLVGIVAFFYVMILDFLGD